MPARTFAVVISMLAAGVASVGSVAAARVNAPHSGRAQTFRVLVFGSVSGPGDGLQYTTPHAQYRLTRTYADGKLTDLTWQREIRQNGHRYSNQVVVDPGQKSWFEQRNTYGPLPPHPFGIRSSALQVARGIRDGKAQRHGLSHLYGQQVRLLTVSQDKNVRSDRLWVNAATDRPVAEAQTYIVVACVVAPTAGIGRASHSRLWIRSATSRRFQPGT